MTYCKKCKEFVEAIITEELAYKEIRMEFVTYQKLVARCSKCGEVLDIAEINDENAKRVLDELENFNILSPFQD